MQALQLVVILALRSLVAHRMKSLVVGGLLFAGTFTVVLGHALLDSVEASMQRSITGSLAGHLQVYAADARDPLSLFGGFGLGSTDIGEIEHFEDVEAVLQSAGGVAAIVPMGITSATVFGRNEIDQVLADLRDAIRDDDRAAITPLLGRLHRIVDDLARELETANAIADAESVTRTREALKAAQDPALWASFDDDPLAVLDLLDARVAPLASDGRLLYLSVIGTDPERFEQTFDRFHIVEGQAIPPGKPGFLFSHRTYEQLIKNPVAAELDRLHKAVVEDGERIADDPLLAERVARNARQYRRITFQLDVDEADQIRRKLHDLLPDTDGDLDTLVQAFLTVDDDTIDARHAFFYEHIAPLIPLHEVPVGGIITLRGFTKSGFVKAINVPVYGTYDFTGLEDAGLQSATNLVDLTTFRELYGKMSDRDKAELSTIRESVGVQEVARDDVEAMLFGGGAVEVEAQPQGEVVVDLDAVAVEDPWARTFPRDEVERGLVLNIAVVLDDPRDLGAEQARLQRALDDAGLKLQVVDWKSAAGTLGQFVTVMRLVLYVALSIIFLVALIIVNNAMVMATLDRVPEIGTLRAIGAQRSHVLGLILLETALLGLFAGGAGALAALGVVAWLGSVGIPAAAEVLVLLFSGPRLYPSAGLDDLLFGIIAITTVAVVSTIYPAVMAARVPPIVAMRGKD